MPEIRLFLVLLAAVSLAGCGEPEPVRLGFLGGLTGRMADLGTGGRNGAQLAVEQANAAGGIGGRPVTLILRDDAGDPDVGQQRVGELLAQPVEAIIGPMTSAMAVAVAPLATRAGVLMMGGTVTTNDLTGLDDQFFRPIAASTRHAATMARYLARQRGVKRVHALVNLGNRAYAESWLDNFQHAFEPLGGTVVRRLSYEPADNLDFEPLARELADGHPEAIILVTNAVDAALLANQFRRWPSRALMVTTEWAGTGKLTELGGSHVEGYVVPQYLDTGNDQPAFRQFLADYRVRFREEAGFPAVVGYDAANVVLRALRERHPGESLKVTILRLRRFEGVQEAIVFDDHGDVDSRTYLTVIRQGRYVPLR